MFDYMETLYIVLFFISLSMLCVIPIYITNIKVKKTIKKIKEHNKNLNILYNIPYMDRSHTKSVVFMRDEGINYGSTVAFHLKHGKWSKIVNHSPEEIESFAKMVEEGEYIPLVV